MTTTAVAPPPPPLRRRRGMTDQAADAAVEQACRDLRLPTIRARAQEMLTAAEKEQLTYRGFLAELLLAEATTGPGGGPPAGSRPPASPGTSGSATSTSPPTPRSTRPPSTPWPPQPGCGPGTPCV